MGEENSNRHEKTKRTKVLINASIRKGRDIDHVRAFLTAGDTPLRNVRVQEVMRYTIMQCPVCGKDVDMETEDYEQNHQGEILHQECYAKTEKYESIEIPLALINAVDIYVKNHPQLGFGDRADVISYIVRSDLEKECIKAATNRPEEDLDASNAPIIVYLHAYLHDEPEYNRFHAAISPFATYEQGSSWKNMKNQNAIPPKSEKICVQCGKPIPVEELEWSGEEPFHRSCLENL